MFAGLADLVARHGYAMVVLFVSAEGFGIPLPGESALIIAAAIAARGRLSLVGVVAAGAAGAVLGGTGGYWVGRLGGTVVLRRGPALDRARQFFDRYGAPSVFLGRFVALLRTLVGMLAGATGMPFARFSVYNALGGLVWAAVVAESGFLVGRSLPRLRGLGRAGLVVALLVFVLAALGVGWRWFRARRPELRQRVARLGRSYLAVHLAVGFLCGLATILAFGGATESVFSHDTLAPFDVILATWFALHTPILVTGAVALFTAISGPAALTVIGVGVAMLLLEKRRRRAAGVWAAALVGAVLLDVSVGIVVRRAPAPNADALSLAAIGLGGGAAAGTVLVYGMLAYLVAGRAGPLRRTVIGGAAVLLIGAIGLARLALGAQYFSGLLTGYAAGFVWLATCVTGLDLVATDAKVTPLER
jgi:membrane protein DedA with SNARE-associated domain